MPKPKCHTPEYKFKLVLEALKSEKKIIEIASENQIHPKQIHRWRNTLLEEGASLFVHKKIQRQADPDKEKLLSIIDQLTIELEFIKKKLKRND